MKEYMKSKIELLKQEVEYYSNVISEIETRKSSYEKPTPASDNYFERERLYAEYHLFRAQAELNRLENRLNSQSQIRVLK